MKFKLIESIDDRRYDPPYNAEQIKANYGEELYNKLIQDPAHKWRMETGIELIHKEPAKKELDRIWNNWQLMTPEQKSLSDEKSLELFGLSNKENYDNLISLYEDWNKLGEEKLDEATIRGETSLRQFLCSLLGWACHYTLIDTDYVIHHKDGNHFNNNYDNIILLPKLSGSNPNTTLHNLYRAGKIDFSSTNPILYNKYLDQLEIMKGIDVFISLSGHRLLNSKGKII